MFSYAVRVMFIAFVFYFLLFIVQYIIANEKAHSRSSCRLLYRDVSYKVIILIDISNYLPSLYHLLLLGLLNYEYFALILERLVHDSTHLAD